MLPWKTALSRAGRLRNLSVKGQIIILGFVAIAVITQFCHCSIKATIENTQMNVCGCAPIKLYLQKQAVGCIWHIANSLEHTFLDVT